MGSVSCHPFRLVVLIAAVIATMSAAVPGQQTKSQPQDGATEKQQTAQDVVTPPKETNSEISRIKSLIHDLRNIEDPDFGFDPNSLSGGFFYPVPSSESLFVRISISNGRQRSDALVALVELGPKVLPYLLESLDDNTPTKFVVEHPGGIGAMWYAERPAIRWAAAEDDKNFLLPRIDEEFNPANPREKKVLDRARLEFAQLSEDEQKGFSFDGAIKKHHMTVGDICYVIIGQITNRSYRSAQYQPTACSFISSPVHDKQLAEDVRAIWQTPNADKALYDSLLIDFKSDKEAFGYRNGAIMRLGYYFPKESAPLFLELLGKIDLLKKKNSSPYPDADTSLIEAMSVSKSERVKQKLVEIMQSTTDIDIFRASLDAVDASHEPLALRRSAEFLKSIKDDKEAWSYEGQPLLEAIGVRFSERATETYKDFLNNTNLRGQAALCITLRRTAQEISAEVLEPLLKNKSEVPDYVEPNRLCDLAAETISMNEKSLEFDSEASEEKRDRQIQKISQELHENGR